jgi:hypothetical protein
MDRYREFGLVSDEDELLRRAFRDGFKRAGLSFSQLLDALAWYRDQPKVEASEEHLVDAFARFAAERNWPAAHCDRALDVYRAIREKGPAAVAGPAPTQDADRAMLAEGDRLLRADPARYWGDAELQDTLFDARERLGSEAQTAAKGPVARSADEQRIAEIEALLHDPSGKGQRRYWNDAALRTDYAEALARVHDDSEASGFVAVQVEPGPPALTVSDGESSVRTDA